VFALAVYITVGIPSSRTVAVPVVGVDTREDQIEALRILSAGNTIIIALLGAVLALQVTQPFFCLSVVLMLINLLPLMRFSWNFFHVYLL
jgi:hypothetical protein